MGEHPNATVVRELMAAFNSGDPDAVKARLAPDVKWHMIGGQTVEGVDALEGAMGQMGDDFSLETDLHDVVANDDHAIALVTATARAGGDEFIYRTAEIAHIKDGRVTERWAFSDDTAAIDEWFGRFA